MKSLFALTALSLMTLPAFASTCPEGIWDFGRGKALALVLCADDQSALLKFCNREVVLNGGPCNHIGSAILCEPAADRWTCREGDGFRADLNVREDGRLDYRFQSSFNSGELIGERIDEH